METTKERLAVVTVTYNSSATIAAFLQSFRQHHGPSPVILVVDNDSEDAHETQKICLQWGAAFLSAGGNLGYGAGMNLGVSQLPEGITTVLLSNPDLTFVNDALNLLDKELSLDPRVGFVGPQILDEGGEIYPSAREFPSLRIGIGHAIFSRIWKNNPWTSAYHSGAVDYSQKAYPGWLSGACIGARMEAFTNIQGFDTAFFMYFEDVDLSLRAREAGWVRIYSPEAKVIHEGSHSTQGSSRKMLSEHHKSAFIYLGRKYSKWYLWPVRVVLWAGLRIRLSWELSRHGR